ncbi:nucleotidyltransferase domain-containing protein [Clostridium sp. Marseille-P2415]|uniref:nucleotidyltransferase domain-containing protein n=1 Tax=Clostridium sp. Marseille-P2415 TaxID=1805471 RepID=UPI000988644C|nr:nucleotidyltransferase domain-containing protein [Clostridium sp. Marseille-P2415]
MKRHMQSINSALKILCSEAYKPYIEAVYLYGSCARGDQKFDSDVDLLLQCNDKFTPAIGRRMRIDAMPDNWNLPEVELKFVYGDSWKTGRDQFSRNLEKEGVLLKP